MSLINSVQPFTVRIFGNDLLTFQDYIQVLKRKLGRISIAESEAINAAIIRVNILATPELLEQEMEEMQLDEDGKKYFRQFAEVFMERFNSDVEKVMERRAAVDNRKNRSKSE